MWVLVKWIGKVCGRSGSVWVGKHTHRHTHTQPGRSGSGDSGKVMDTVWVWSPKHSYFLNSTWDFRPSDIRQGF